MTGLVQTSSNATKPPSSLPRIVCGTPLVLGPELASMRALHSLLLRMSLHIFDILLISPYMFV